MSEIKVNFEEKEIVDSKNENKCQLVKIDKRILIPVVIASLATLSGALLFIKSRKS